MDEEMKTVEGRMLAMFGFFAIRIAPTGGFVVVKVRSRVGMLHHRIYSAVGYKRFCS